MTNRFVDLDKLIEALENMRNDDRRAVLETLDISHSNNPQLSVKIGLERKNKLEWIAYQNKSDISKITRAILDNYFDNYYDDGTNINSDLFAAWSDPFDAMKDCR